MAFPQFFRRKAQRYARTPGCLKILNIIRELIFSSAQIGNQLMAIFNNNRRRVVDELR